MRLLARRFGRTTCKTRGQFRRLRNRWLKLLFVESHFPRRTFGLQVVAAPEDPGTASIKAKIETCGLGQVCCQSGSGHLSEGWGWLWLCVADVLPRVGRE